MRARDRPRARECDEYECWACIEKFVASARQQGSRDEVDAQAGSCAGKTTTNVAQRNQPGGSELQQIASGQYFLVIHQLATRDFGYPLIASGTLHDCGIEGERK